MRQSIEETTDFCALCPPASTHESVQRSHVELFLTLPAPVAFASLVPIMRECGHTMSDANTASAIPTWRRYPIGIEISPSGDVHARVWAPKRKRVDVELRERADSAPRYVPLAAEPDGYFSGTIPDASAGLRYRFRLDGKDAFPDPISRAQPEGPHGASLIVDPRAFRWRDSEWRGVSIDGQVISEVHIGTFTPEGTFLAAAERLSQIAEVGITCVEVMPVADFAGRFGWGYDGVNLFAPTHAYGTPDEFRAFVDRAHELGLGVLLDVVYNHFGPDGNYLPQFADEYFAKEKHTEWGEALNFDERGSGPVREFFLANAAYWIEEFHIDGLRLDATQQIFDGSPTHIVQEVVAVVHRTAAAAGRTAITIAENEPQDTTLIRDESCGGYGVDAAWNDDFHHSAVVALTGRDEAYYSGYRGTSQELISAAKYGFLYQGQWYAWQKQRRGTPALDLPPTKFVNFLENHDQVANSGRGERLCEVAHKGRSHAMTALLLLLPQTPLLFQGQEFGSSRPFFYFADHKPELAQLVAKGRAKFLAQFPSLATAAGRARIPDPADPTTFERCKLDWSEREQHTDVLALHRDLLRLRRNDPVLSSQRPRALDGAGLTSSAFALRYFDAEYGDRLLVVNLGRRLTMDPAAEPLLAPPAHSRWCVALSTEDPRYGGWGTPDPDADGRGWVLSPESAVLLIPNVRPHEPTDR
jgi:maltooligosyltrehalose trehalohydrolase